MREKDGLTSKSDNRAAPDIKKVYGAEACVYPHPVNSLPTTLITAGGNRRTTCYNSAPQLLTYEREETD